ncbi:23S rRNA (guanosine(2251)-2'-O)-methyltransferase RlmB [Enterococcus hirae]|nr:23S rRNA (guanosine(2251)-2'-O)-methyltransferase RlmB [Enterococcus hirae]
MKNNKNRKQRKPLHQTRENASTAQTDFVYGNYAVEEALEQERGNKLFIQEELSGRRIDHLKNLAKDKKVPIQWVPKNKLDDLSDNGVHQGVVLGVTPYKYWALEDLLKKVKNSDAPFLLVLDEIEDPHNFGSILRTADAGGVDGVIVPKHRASGITSVVSKASTGAVEYMPIARVTNLSQTLSILKEAGFWIFGTDVAGTNYTKWNAAGAVALIIGNEGKGVSAGLKKQVDEMLTIPMTGHVQSLNAGVAAGILIYEAFRQRGFSQ